MKIWAGLGAGEGHRQFRHRGRHFACRAPPAIAVQAGGKVNGNHTGKTPQALGDLCHETRQRQSDSRSQQTVHQDVGPGRIEMGPESFGPVVFIGDPLKGNPHLSGHLQIGPGVTPHGLRPGHQHHLRGHVSQVEVPGHHQAVSSVVSLAADHQHPQAPELAKVPLHLTHHTAAGVLHEQQAGDTVPRRGLPVHPAHLIARQYPHLTSARRSGGALPLGPI